MSGEGSVLSDIFTGCAGLIEIRPLPPGRHPIRFFPTVGAAMNYAYSLDHKADVYFGAGTRLRKSGTKADVREIPGVWADCDKPDAVEKLNSFSFRPTIEIETSPGRQHAYWLFKEPLLIEGDSTIATVEGVLRGIAAILGSDLAVCEVARIMRMPGTHNVKRNAICRVLRRDGPRYDLADFIEAGIFREMGAASGNGHHPERLDTAAVLAGVPEGERDRTLFRFACKLRRADIPKGVAEGLVLKAAGQCDPPFPAGAARAKVTRAYALYPAEPVPSKPTPAGIVTKEPDDPPVESWPDPPAEATYSGILGEIVHAIEPHTEADPVGILIQLLVGLGDLIGGAPFYRVEGSAHHVNEFVVLVGRTAGGRKGTSWDQARRVLGAVDEEWARERIQGGLSSGEGLIGAVRDKREERRPVMEKGRCVDYTTVEVDAGVEDKRLLVIEPEFARVLKVMLREGCTLSTVLREAWDRPDLRVMTKTPVKATGAHISVIAHITTEELLRQLQDTEAASGFGNRFMWIAVRRARLLPDGGDLDVASLAPLLARLQIAVDAARRTREMARDPEARKLWEQEYERLTKGRAGLLGSMLSRAEAHVLRLSMLFALTDSSKTIRRPHLEAALALWDYSARSAAFVFGDSLGDPTADELLKALRDAEPGDMTRTAIREHFGRNKSSAELGRALGVLARQELAYCVTEKQDGPGRPTERWSTRKAGVQ